MSYNESLSANSNYPPMTQSQWDNAPFNEPPTPEPVDVSCGVSLTLNHSNVMLSTDKYTVDSGEDEEGHWIETREFESCDLIEEYNESPLNILNLLAEFKEVLEERETMYLHSIANYEDILKNNKPNHPKNIEKQILLTKKYLRNVRLKIAMCENWEVSDIYVEEE